MVEVMWAGGLKEVDDCLKTIRHRHRTPVFLSFDIPYGVRSTRLRDEVRVPVPWNWNLNLGGGGGRDGEVATRVPRQGLPAWHECIFTTECPRTVYEQASTSVID